MNYPWLMGGTAAKELLYAIKHDFNKYIGFSIKEIGISADVYNYLENQLKKDEKFYQALLNEKCCGSYDKHFHFLEIMVKCLQ